MTRSKKKSFFRYVTGRGQTDDLSLDTDHVGSLLRDGADINYSDRTGHTSLHEVARYWPVDDAQYLLKQGAAVDPTDQYGRTPLHVAAASDRPKMVDLLIKFGADKEARTKDELQTPVHMAARKDAAQSLRVLIDKGCLYKEIQDYKGRTPLHLAAELDRTVTARYLLEMGAPVTVSDRSGTIALTWIIARMPQIANRGLNQLRLTDNQNRKQHIMINHLTPGLSEGTHHSPFQVAVHYRQFQVLSHPTMSKLLDVMWNRFGLLYVWVEFLLNLVYILLWTVQGVVVEYDQRHLYNLPGDWWRIVLFLTAIGFTVWQIIEEFQEFYRSKRANKTWCEWRKADIQKDMEFCHPKWPHEKTFLERELDDLEKKAPTYFQDRWNIFDWICYVLLLACVITHLTDVISHSELLARWHIRIMCVTIILLWLRLLKCARGFTLVGPFIVMLGHMMTDLLRFLFLFLEFYIPFVCAFWMVYGGDKVQEGGTETVEVEGFGHFGEVCFTLFQLTLVDEYDFEHMKLVDSLMTYLLLTSWFTLSAVLCLNLFIALLTNTFQTVYDNAKDNAMMQKAIIMLSFWDGMSKKRQEKFLSHVTKHCSPLVEYYDDDVTRRGEDLKRVTMQIRTQLNDMQGNWREKFGDKETQQMEACMDPTELPEGRVLTADRFKRDLYPLQLSIEDVKQRQDALISSYNKDMGQLLRTLKLLEETMGHTRKGNFDGGINSIEQESKKKKKKKRSKKVGLLNVDIDSVEEGHESC